MNKKYLMAADVGTQSAKVVIFDLDGTIICQASQKLQKLNIPAPLLAEHPDDDVWDSLKTAFKAVLTQFQNNMGGDINDIKAMGLCVIRCCRALLKSDGTLAYPIINWMDKRLNSPYEYSDTYGDVRYITTSSGYITHRLTSEFKDTCANYIGWWPMDNDTFDWSQDSQAFKSCNIPRTMLFDVVKPGQILGNVTDQAAKLTGLPKGLPVVATAHDKAVEALGAGSLASGNVLISLGTYIGAMVNGHQNVKNALHFWPFQAAIPGRYLYECMGVRRGMWTVSWFCDQFGKTIINDARQLNTSIEEMFNQEAEQIPAGCEGLLTIHDWAPPSEAVFRKGVMLGFDGRHTRAHIYRSILEGIAFTIKNHVDKMARELAMPIEKLIITGGGAHSNVFMQIFADVFGVETHRNQMKGSASVGCAINAGMAIDVFDSYEKAIKKMVRTGGSFTPIRKNYNLYSQLNETVYIQANNYLDPLLKKLSPLVDQE